MRNDNYSVDSTSDDTQTSNEVYPTPYKKEIKYSENKKKDLDLYIYTKNKLSIDIQDSYIHFSELRASVPQKRTQIITINGSQYSLKANQSHLLKNDALNLSIPNTTCDKGNCDYKQAAPWKNVMTFGFGFRCDSEPSSFCSKDFAQEDYYRNFFWDNGTNSEASLLTNALEKETSTKIRITYKINASLAESKTNYNTTITYLVSPLY